MARSCCGRNFETFSSSPPAAPPPLDHSLSTRSNYPHHHSPPQQQLNGVPTPVPNNDGPQVRASIVAQGETRSNHPSAVLHDTDGSAVLAIFRVSFSTFGHRRHGIQVAVACGRSETVYLDVSASDLESILAHIASPTPVFANHSTPATLPIVSRNQIRHNIFKNTVPGQHIVHHFPSTYLHLGNRDRDF